jgi:phosphoribosyl 1,2-cyclic phosphodiesterase
MRVTVLGSGSGGNSVLVEAGETRLLVDAGFSGRDVERRLLAVGVEPASLQGILITHDHGDHTRGAGILARRFGLPLHMTRLTAAAIAPLLNGREALRPYDSAHSFTIGPLEIRPFLTVHDAADPIAVTLTDTGTGDRLGIATDLGRPTAAVRACLAGCHLLVLEANHDEALLWNGPYPWSVKQRIAGSHGHLSNHASAELARELCHPGLAGVILAHLSEHCNVPELAREVVGAALERSGYGGLVVVAGQETPLEPVDVAALRLRMAPPQLTLL